MKNKNFIITISGTPGSGKSTIAKDLVKFFDAKRVYVGGIRRELAKEMGMTLAELNEYALTHSETDIDVDKKAAQTAEEYAQNNPVIVEGRTQFYFLPNSIKLYIKASHEEGAKRIWLSLQKEENKKKRNEANVNSFEELAEKTKERENNDIARYQKYYGFDHTDTKHYDFILDTSNISAKQATNEVLKYLDKKHGIRH